MKLVKQSVMRPVGVTMIVLAVLALGLMSVRNLAVDLFPKIDLPIAVVATSYEDAAPEEVENLISRPIESAVSTVEGLEVVQSQSQAGSSLVLMMFKTDVDIDQALLDVREQVDSISSMLPEEAGDPNILRFNPEAMPIVYLGISGKDIATLTEVANTQIVPHIERQAGVASATLEGAVEREIQIELDPAKLTQYGITTQDVLQALNSTNQSASVGTVDKGHQDLQLRVTGEFESLDDIEETIIQTQTGTQVLVEDIATVSDTYKDQSSISIVNGEPALVVSVMKQTDANTVDVATTVRDSLDQINSELNGDVQLDVLIDTSEFIQFSIDSVLKNIVIGGIIAVFILLLFLKSVRATLVIAISIPIALITTFALMYFTGQTLNVLTLGGLALGVGLMLDSSIIILENIYKYRSEGYELKEAAIKGATELTPAVIAVTMTTLVVFLPMIFVEGIASDLFMPLAMTVSFSLVASLIVAITLVPMLSSKFLSKVMDNSGRRYWFNRFLDWLKDKYSGGLKHVLKYRKTTVAVTVLAIVASLFLIPSIGAELIPSADQGQAQITVETEPGTTMEHMEEIVTEVNTVLAEFSDVLDINYVTFGNTGFTQSNQATFTLQLVPASEREQTTEEILRDMDEKFQLIAGAEITASAMDSGAMSMGSDPIMIQLNGPEHEVLQELSQDVVDAISDVDGVFNPTTQASEGIPQMAIDIDQGKAAAYGLTEEQIISQIQLRFNGQLATFYREEGQEMDVRLYYPEEERSSISDLMDMPVQTPQGAVLPLDELAELNEQEGPVALYRENQQPQMNVTSDISGRDLGSVSADIQTVLDGMDFPEGYSYHMGGQVEDMQEAFVDLAIALIFSIFLVYAVMAVQFENQLQPFIIMFALPTGTIGVMLGLWLTDVALSIPTFIGIIMLVGIVVNNSIVLVDYTNILRRRGMERYEAVIEAGRSRLRPILMTTLTTVLAMVPLGLALGEGAELQQPLAVTIIFGLSTSSIFTLFFVPVVYTILDDLSNKFRNRKKKA